MARPLKMNVETHAPGWAAFFKSYLSLPAATYSSVVLGIITLLTGGGLYPVPAFGYGSPKATP